MRRGVGPKEAASRSAKSSHFAASAGRLSVFACNCSLSRADDINNNQAESFNWRMRRSVEGIYLSPSNKCLMNYAAENAWREDMRRLSTGKKTQHILRVALGVGLSRWWRGYTHGQRRTEELLAEGPQEAKTRGKWKGWKPKPPK